MSRGQQGIGISAAGMYGQLTTGKPVQIISRTGAKSPAHFFEVQIDTKKNEPLILEKKQIEWEAPAGPRSPWRPRAAIRRGGRRSTSPREIKPHPYGIELGVLLKMLQVYRGNPFVIEAGLAYGRGPEQAKTDQQKQAVPLCHRGLRGGRCPSMGGYVTTRGSTDGRAGARRALVLPSLMTCQLNSDLATLMSGTPRVQGPDGGR